MWTCFSTGYTCLYKNFQNKNDGPYLCVGEQGKIEVEKGSGCEGKGG